MKHVKNFFLLFVAMASSYCTKAQTGYIYAHLKHISEENSPTATTPPDYSFVLKNSSGTTISSFSLNDQATSDNVPNSGNFLNTYDIGLSHGTGGDGQLWAVAGTSLGVSEANQTGKSATSANNATGSIYCRNAGSSIWMQAKNGSTAITGVKYIDGAYANQCVYSTTSGVFFYYNGAVVQIYSGSGVNDVTANGGRIAISNGSQVYVYSNTYSNTATPATGGNWIPLSATTITSGSRIDMNLAANTIAVEYASSNTVKTIGFTITSSTTAASTASTLTSPGNAAAAYWDIAYDDAGNIYSVASSTSTASDQVFNYNGSAWTVEPQARCLDVITGGAAHLVYGINLEGVTSTPFDCTSIFSRQIDQSGNIYWIDDERIKSSASLNGNGIVIPVSPGTYTLTETLPNSTTYDLGRYNIYDPGGSTAGNVNTQVVTYVVTANEVAFAEYVNEELVPKAITLTCNFQNLQTFDASNSSPVKTYTYGNGTYGGNIEGTSYHYWNSSDAQDGYYMVVANTANWVNNTGLTDHTGNGGYFLLINASYALDEFYRQRVTNLVPGISYTIAFWAADVSPSNPLHPSVTYGLQDSLGNIVNSASTGTFTNSGWIQFSFTFTATTSRADLFLKNNNIGGNGNDLAIDDISINPVYPTLAANTVSPSTTDICIGTNYNFSNSTSGGIWTSSTTSVATINAKSGVAAGHSPGNAVITYTYSNAIGCSTTSASSITVAAPPVVTATDKLGGSICLNQADSLYTNFTTTSTAPYTYAWVASPSSGAGLGTANVQNTSATPTAGGTYTFVTTVTDAVGCAATSSVTVAVASNSAPTVSATATVTSLLCISPALITLNGSISGSLNPKYSYVWSGPGTISNPSSGSTSATTYNTTASSSAAGQYTLTVTDGNGCKSSATTTTSSPAPISVVVSAYATAECSNTSDSVFAAATGGTGALTYAWSSLLPPGTITYSPNSTSARTKVSFSTAGSYTFTATVTDSKGCTGTGNTTIKYLNTPGPTVSGLNTATTICLGSTINLSGTVADKLSGTQIGTASNVLEPISNAFDGSTSSYYEYFGSGAWVGLDLGTAQQITQITYYPAQGLEPYMIGGSFQGSNSATFSSGVTTFYTVTSQPSDAYQTITVTSSTAFRYVRFLEPASGTYANIVCAIAELNFFGSAGYVWSGSPAGNGLGSTTTIPTTAVPTAAGAYTYTLTATDGNGCVAAASTGTQTVNPVPTVTATGTTPAFCGATATDQLYAVATGGSGSYNSYAWSSAVVSGSATTSLSSTSIYNPVASISGASTGNAFQYTVVVTDNNGCTTTASTSAVLVSTSPAVSSVTATPSSSCAGTNTTIALSGAFSGGTAPYNYAWTPPSNSTVTPSAGSTSSSPVNASATGTGAQNYSYALTIVDANNCTATGSNSVVSLNQGPAISLTASNYSVCANPQTAINLYGSLTTATTSPYTYIWTGSGVANNTANDTTTATPTASGTYTVNVTDVNGCTASATSPTVSVDQAYPNITYTCGTNGSGVNYLQFDETNGTSWNWTTTNGGRFYPDNTLSANNDASTSTLQAPYIDYNGTYSVQITDAAGCIGSGSLSVTSATCTVILAVNNLSFAVQKQGNEALLSWSTQSETNNNHFDVQRSGDGINWVVVGTVKAAGNSSTVAKYSFVDALPLEGDNYYKLAEVDDNGNVSYSPVKWIDFAGLRIIKIYPNPAQNYIVLEFNNNKDEKAVIVITSMLGKTVLNEGVQLVKGLNIITLNQLQQLVKGTYIITIATDENISRSKFIKGGN